MEKINRLTLLRKRVRRAKSGWQNEYLCTCGNKTIKTPYKVGRSSFSCGCYKRERMVQESTTHNGTNDKLYGVWIGMKMRCYNKKNAGYKNYGGRGIKVCDHWVSNYGAFRKWANENGYKGGLTIERKDVNGDYSPTNCTWIPKRFQSYNQTHTMGWELVKELRAQYPKMSTRQLANKYGLNIGAINKAVRFKTYKEEYNPSKNENTKQSNSY